MVLLWVASVTLLGPALMRWSRLFLELCGCSSAGCLGGAAVRSRGRMVGGPSAWGRAPVQRMPPFRTLVV